MGCRGFAGLMIGTGDKVIAHKIKVVIEFARRKNIIIFCLFNHEVKYGGGIIMFGTDVTTSQVLSMYLVVFVFFFVLSVVLLKKNS